MNLFRKIIWKNRGWVVLHCAMGILRAFLESFQDSYLQRIVDAFPAKTLTGGMIMLYAAAMVTLYVSNYLDNYPDRRLNHSVYLDFKLEALEKISRIRYDAYQSLGTGKLIQRIENGAQAGKNILVDFYLCLVRELIPSIVFAMYFIWRQNPGIMAVLLAGYVVVFLVSNLLLRKLYEIKERILDREEEFQHFLVRGFQEMVVFRMHRRFGEELERARRAKREIVDGKVKITMVHEAFFTIFALLVAAVKIGLFVYAWRTGNVSVGAVVALMALVDRAYTPVAIFNVLFVDYKLEKNAYQRFAEFFGLPEETRLRTGSAPVSGIGALTVSGLYFDYGKKEILRGIDLAAEPGDRIAFVGESGCGKSTLVKLIVGLLHKRRGSIMIGGKPIGEMRLEDFYPRVSYVPQEGSIFDGSLRENLDLSGQRPEARLWDALRAVNLFDTVKKMPEGLDSYLGERGTVLSGGEKQRLALARMLLEDTELVVLDEATSAIDNLNEEEILNRILQRTEGRTLILIAHRLNAVAKFDRIVVFRDGTVQAEGSFHELMENCGYFRELYRAGEDR